MSQEIRKAGYQTPDGKLFDTKAEALDHLRRPQKVAALNKLNDGNADLTNWLLDNEDAILDTFESTKIRRVTKSEKKQLEKALDAIVKSGDKAFAFIIENKEAVSESFRWPTVKRQSPEDQAITIRNGFLALAGEENGELVDWMIEQKDKLLEAFEAGKVKAPVNEKAATALAEWRAKQAAEKAAKAAAPAAE